LLALVLAARVVTTIVLIDSVRVAVSHSSSRLVVWHNILLFLTLLELRLPPKDRQHIRIVLAVVVASMILPAVLIIDIYLSRLTRHRTRHILLSVVLAGWVMPAILLLIGIIPVTSCLPSYSPPGW